MSRETILTDDEGNKYSLDNLATQKWLDGHYSGLDDCCAWLDQKATALFSQRKRQQATEMQELADEMKKELRPKMVKRATEHEAEYPWRLTTEGTAP